MTSILPRQDPEQKLVEHDNRIETRSDEPAVGLEAFLQRVAKLGTGEFHRFLRGEIERIDIQTGAILLLWQAGRFLCRKALKRGGVALIGGPRLDSVALF